jgi:hypothetical protein
MRDWNLTLGKQERVRVVGVDIEHQVRISIWHLAGLVKSPAPAAIRDVTSRLAEMAATKPADADIQNLAGELIASLQEHPREYADLLADRLFDFELVAANLQRVAEYYAGKKSGTYNALRDRAMYDTFRKVEARMPGAKFYGRWGNAHVSQLRYDNAGWLASLLDRPDSPVAGKVVSIWPLYQNSEQLLSSGNRYSTRSLSDNPALLKPFIEAAASQVALFKLTGPDSPFAKSLYRFSRSDGGVTTDYAQYFVLIRDAAASHPLAAARQ